MINVSGPIQDVTKLEDGVNIMVGNQSMKVSKKGLGKKEFEDAEPKLKKNTWIHIQCDADVEKSGNVVWLAQAISIDTKFKPNTEKPVW